LLAVLSSQRQDVLLPWYRRDDNALPQHYLLQPIPDQAGWNRAEQELRAILQDAVLDSEVSVNTRKGRKTNER
jgi:hypothetical protein